MFAMKEYPSDVMPLYAQGHSLSQWLIESRGRKAFLEFLSDGMQDENWPRAVHEHYGFDGLNTMQTAWIDWVKQGRPQLTPETSPIGQLVANTRAALTLAESLRHRSFAGRVPMTLHPSDWTQPRRPDWTRPTRPC